MKRERAERRHRKQQDGEDGDNQTNKDTQPRLDGSCVSDRMRREGADCVQQSK